MCKAGANPEQINIRLSGTPSPETSLEKGTMGLSVNEQGELVTETALGLVKFTKPVAYQEINGKRVEVEVGYMVKDSASTRPGIKNQGLEYGFTVASYDRTKDLIIDPLLASTFLGGSDKERGNAIALDSNDNVFVTGQTLSTNFPTIAGAYDETYIGGDIFISKFNDNLTILLASTFLGGSDEDWGNCIALDSSDNVFVTGHTFSTDLPTTIGAYDKTLSGFKDAFVSKLSNELGTLTASTYLGGNGSDWGTGIVIDKNDNSVFVSGYSNSANYPTTTGAYDQTYNGDQDVVVSKLSNNLGTLTASTYLGGNRASEQCNAIALDSNGNVFVTGWTGSSDFPTTTGAHDVDFNGSTNYGDVFVSKFPNDLGTLTASTFLGGSSDEIGNCIALDSNDNVFVSGYTKSANYPTTLEAYNRTYMGGSDIFISKFKNDLTSLLASTLLGKSQDDECYGIALDKSDHVLVTGFTGSADFPTTSGAYDDTFNGYYDAFASKFSNDLKNLLESTFFGGIYFEEGKGFAIDSSDNIFVVGWGGSPNFPTTTGAYQETLKGRQDGETSDAFVVQFNNFTIISPTPTPGTSTPTSTPGTPTPTPVSTATPTPDTPTPTPVSTATPTPGTPTPTPVSTATPTPGTPTPTPTPASTATPTPTPSPTPVPCKAKKLNVKPKSLKLWLGNDTEKTVILTCKAGLPSVNQPVKAKVVSGKKFVTVSPAEAYTDEEGQATFTITATEKKGTAVVRFKHKNLIGDITVKVKKATE
ncbi:MAG: SBBP repeat-containing protein [Candidatus Brocadia sp.]|nr:MAG: SBBP repeat-containing protein [Candidatus Brocadia sp.]